MLKEKFTHLSRKQKQIIMILSDVFILLFSIWLSFALRLGEFWSDRLYTNQWIFILIPTVSIPLFIRFGTVQICTKIYGHKGYCYSISVYYYNKSFCWFCHDDISEKQICQERLFLFFGLSLVFSLLSCGFYTRVIYTLGIIL
jgi:FlaA1/EpsC-like NDP-sugar epimerase